MANELFAEDEEATERNKLNSLSDFLPILKSLGSLKFTVTLFALSLIIVLVGTLAQDEMNMPEVKQRYFTAWIAELHIDDMFPKAFFPHKDPIQFLGIKHIPFPGGALIGLCLLVNLLAAKATRFKIKANGGKLTSGLVFMVAGAVVAGLVIASGHSSDGLQGTPPMEYTTLWKLCLATCAASAFASFSYAIGNQQKFIRYGLLATTALLGGFVVFSLITDFRIGDPGLRIVWQLAKGLGAGLIMLVGCVLLFGKQGGNVLLHLGVALLMFGQFMFGDRQTEQRLSLVEGESTNTLINLDKVELTFSQVIDDERKVIAVPASKLIAAAEDFKQAKKALEDADESEDTRLSEQFAKAGRISDEMLPADVKVLEFFHNSKLADVDDDNLATKGIGTEIQAVKLRKHGGTDAEMNTASAYVELLDKKSGDSLGVYLVGQLLSNRNLLFPGQGETDQYDSITLGDEDYELGLEFHREVKPYWVQLEDVRRINYSGTETPRDYSSFIRIVDPATGEDQHERVWMNNPLRFRGESFFQSSYSPLPGGKEMTGIQVVRNSGWLIPYVACSITALGMLAHFWGTLVRFVRRREREKVKIAAVNNSLVGLVAFVLAGLFAASMLVNWGAVKNNMRAAERAKGFDLYEAGKLPVSFGGRIMPLDAYARQTLKAVSNRESLYLEIVADAYEETDDVKDEENVVDELTPIRDRVDGKKISAIQWLMEVAISDESGPETALRDLPMIRIDSDAVRSEIGLARRKSKLYSLNEIQDDDKVWEHVSLMMKNIRERDSASWTFKERKLIELENRIRQYRITEVALRVPKPPVIPKEYIPEGTSPQMVQMFALQSLEQQMDILRSMPAPRIVPPTELEVDEAVDDPDWSVFAPAFFDNAKSAATGGTAESRPGVDQFHEMIKAYKDEDTQAFNAAVDAHLTSVGEYKVPGYSAKAVSLERWMQTNSPTFNAWILYIMALVAALAYLIVGKQWFRVSIWNLLAVTFIVHTIAICCRIYITGRAPVINIYSSAVFIGWAVVLAGLVVEQVFKSGIGNLLAAVGGMLTLQVAYGLSDGDTMPVLQAVLDTQFWLATHVICVSLGYVATLVAGVLGAVYLMGNWIGKDTKFQKNVYQSCYGTACFGILFSFVGTVLGGLWADDSWGRFWGWDPKENGALLIVIWNALILHARWDGMVKARGFSILAIGGNVVTAWSWFGTNELGIGLHSYGFTQGVLFWLTFFVASQLLLIGAGLLFWRESPAPAAVAE